MRYSRSPCGERGLKCRVATCLLAVRWVARRGGRFDLSMSRGRSRAVILSVAPRAGSVD